jgi:hypothetical protein
MPASGLRLVALNKKKLIIRRIKRRCSFFFVGGSCCAWFRFVCLGFFFSLLSLLSVVRASSFGRGASAFARRSVAVVSAVRSAGGVWVSFPSSPCPSGLVPSGSSSRCFAGFSAGSWSSVAFAVGCGVPFPPSWLLFGFVSLGGGVWFFAG